VQPSKYTSGIALVIHIVVGAPVILAASLLLFLGTLFFDDPTKSYAAFALAVGKYLFVFPVSMPWAIIAQLLKKYTQSLIVSLTALGSLLVTLAVSFITKGTI
jgi:hypothetical protein